MGNRAKEVAQLILARMAGSDIEDEHIGDGVYISKLRDKDITEIYEQNSYLIAKWEKDWTHCLRHEFESDKMSFDDSEQLLTRTLVTSRIVKPTSLAFRFVVKARREAEKVLYDCSSRIGFGTLAYVAESNTKNVIMRDDVRKIKAMWKTMQMIFDDADKYILIIRALRYFELGHWMHIGEVRLTTFHTALEILFGTSSEHIRPQLLQRIPKLHREIDLNQIDKIYRSRSGLSHSGKISSELTPEQKELAETLERIVRATLALILMDKDLLETFADKKKLKDELPVQVIETERKETGRVRFI